MVLFDPDSQAPTPGFVWLFAYLLTAIEKVRTEYVCINGIDYRIIARYSRSIVEVFAVEAKTGEQFVVKRLTHADKRVNTVSRELHAYTLLKNVPGLNLLEIDYQKSSEECLFLTPLCKSFASAILKSVLDENNLWVLLSRRALEQLFLFHGAGYLHCDIRPQNILLGPDGNMVYLIDFEFAIPDGSPMMADNFSLFSALPLLETDDTFCYRYKKHDDLEALFYSIIFSVIKPPSLVRDRRKLCDTAPSRMDIHNDRVAAINSFGVKSDVSLQARAVIECCVESINLIVEWRDKNKNPDLNMLLDLIQGADA